MFCVMETDQALAITNAWNLPDKRTERMHVVDDPDDPRSVFTTSRKRQILQTDKLITLAPRILNIK
jgi:hypothetical protein